MSPPQKTAEAHLIDANNIIRQKSQQILLLKKELAEVHKVNDNAEKIRKEIYGLAALTPDPPKWTTVLRPPHLPGVPMVIWSDFHWGERVYKDQVGGVNEFNRKIARERLRKLVDSTIDLTFNHMVNPDYPGIVVCLGGDMITGGIHDELRETNDGPVQVSLLEIQEQLIAALTTIANKFGNVFVPCVVGNHGRTTIKSRFKNRVFESYEWNLYQQLARHFSGDPRIKFQISDEADASFLVQSHRFLLSHGDALGVKGGDGIIGVLGPIARGAVKLGRAEAQIGRDFDTLLIGHYHTYIPRSDATPVIANGSLIGYNEYARLALRVPYSRPSQALWFMHQKYGITAQWPVYLDDKRKSYEGKDWVKWQVNRPGDWNK